jgi:murein DD-endopeptidase MepM/ murein hydrolase activator NlpD
MSYVAVARPAAGAGLLVGVLLSVLGPLTAAPSHAVPESATELASAWTSAGEQPGRHTGKHAGKTRGATVAESRVERSVERRERALSAMFAVAERHARIEQVRSDRLRALGYTGDLTALETILPLRGYRLSAGFGLAGPLWESSHTGLDFSAPSGTDLVAVADATVTEVADAGPYGLRTILTLEDGTDVWYCHQLVALVSPGESVEIGEVIGLVGSTGNSTGPHLHLEVHPAGGGATDPAAWLSTAGVTP